MAIDNIQADARAIVEVFNPGFGSPMLARTLFGLENRWGKLPYTIYGQVSHAFSPHRRFRLLSLFSRSPHGCVPPSFVLGQDVPSS